MELSEAFLKTPLSKLSVQEFINLMNTCNKSEQQKPEFLFEESTWLSGYKALATYLHCSIPTVCRLVKSGKIDAATRKIGASYWFDKNMIRDLMKV